MKKQLLPVIVVFTIILSGAAGFGGSYLANNFVNSTPVVYDDTVALTNSTHSECKTEQQSTYGNEYPALYEFSDSMDISLINDTDGKVMSDELTIPEIAALASNSVVEIYTESVTNGWRIGQYISEGAGSGVIITSDGYIVTNNHVIEGATKIKVRLKNGNDYEASLIGRDSKTDIAVLKIKETELQPAVYGNSDDLVVGELAVAIGNPLGQLGGTVTEGIISALGRNIDIDNQMMNLLQTTAAVNPGNSGGGLFNRYGEFIGVVNAKSGGSDIEGLGFAIPINIARPVVDALIQYGYIPGRIDFGATLVDIPDARTAMLYRVQALGVYVSHADIDSSLIPGDRIVSIDGKVITSTADIKSILDLHKAGDTLLITVFRNNDSVTFDYKLKQATS